MDPFRSILRRLAREETGVSLIELLLAASIGVLVLFAAYQFNDTAGRSQAATAARADSLQQAQTGLERITRDFRQAATVELATSQSVALTTYVKPDTTGPVPVQYTCADGACTRKVGSGPAVTVVTDVANADVFNPEPDIDPSYVAITLRVRVKGASNTITLRDGVDIRNRAQ